jgi:hypothetical protein
MVQLLYVLWLARSRQSRTAVWKSELIDESRCALVAKMLDFLERFGQNWRSAHELPAATVATMEA